jgi:hypothetical protein
MTDVEKRNLGLATANNNTFRKFIRKYGDRKIREISSPTRSTSSIDVFRGPEIDRYVLDPLDPKGSCIDMGHFFAAAQVPHGLGNHAGLIVEIDQLRRGLASAFQGEDLKSNYLGTVFGRDYLNNPKSGRTLGEKLENFFRDYENGTGAFEPTDVQIYGKVQTNHEEETSSEGKINDEYSSAQKISLESDQVYGKALTMASKDLNLTDDQRVAKALIAAKFNAATVAAVIENGSPTTKTMDESAKGNYAQGVVKAAQANVEGEATKVMSMSKIADRGVESGI